MAQSLAVCRVAESEVYMRAHALVIELLGLRSGRANPIPRHPSLVREPSDHIEAKALRAGRIASLIERGYLRGSDALRAKGR